MKKIYRLILACSLSILAFTHSNLLKAQSCSGTISNGQNLVTNGDFSQGYSGWTYTADPTQTNGYLAFNPPTTANFSTPGMINVGTNPNVFNNAFSTFGDHTSGTGNMLMVDGICVSGINLWSQSNIPITPNTNYYFSVWITSMDNLTPYGTLAFNINGTTLSTISAPGVPGQWIQFTAVWNSGLTPPATATISIQNTTLTGCNNGVDFAIDDVSFSPGCNFGSPGPLPNLGPDFSLCGKTIPFTINPNFAPATAAANNLTYNWYKNGVLQVASSGLGSSFYSFSVNGPGTYAVCVDSAGSCPKTDILVITNTYSISLGPDLTLCNPTTAVLDAGYSGPGVTYQWSKGGTVISGATNKTFSLTTPGTYSVVVNDPVCGTQSASINISTNAAIPNDSTFCPVSSGGTGTTTLSVTGPGKYKWWTAPTGGSVVTTGVSFITPVLSAPGPYTYYVEDTSTFSITAGPPAAGNGFSNPSGIGAGSNQSLLIFNALTDFKIDSITVFPYNYYCPSPGTGNANIVNIIITDASGNTVGTSSYTGQCTGTGQPAAAMKVPVNISVPQGNGYKMMLNTGSTQIALYQNTSMNYPTTYSNALQIVSNNTSVFNQYYDPTAYPGYFDWQITKGINCQRVPVTASLNCPKCTSSTAPTSASVDFPTFCPTTTTQITLSVTGGKGDTLAWYTNSCGGTRIAANATGAPVIIPAPGTATTYYARWESNDGCLSTCVSVAVSPTSPPDASIAGSNQKICNTTSATLNGNIPVNGTGGWSIISGSGTITDTTKANAAVTNLSIGNTVFQWTIRNGTCPSTSSQVTIFRDSIPAPTSASADFPTFCSSTTTQITLSAMGGTGDTLAWYSGSCGGTRIAANTTATPVVITAPAGVTTYYARWESTINSCVSNCASITVTPINPPDASVAGTNQNICNNTSTVLNANTPITGAGGWSIISGSGSISDTTNAKATITNLLPGNLVLQWTIRNGSCPPTFSQVTIHQDTLTIAPVITGLSFDTCASTAGLVYSVKIDHSPKSIYSWTRTGTLDSTNGTLNSITINTGTSGGTLQLTETNGACVLSSTKTIGILAPVIQPVLGPDRIICTNSFLLTTPKYSSGIGNWTFTNGTGSFTNAGDTLFNVTGLVSGINTFTWTVNGCGGPLSASINITVSASYVVAALSGPTDTLCINTPRTLSIAATGGSGNYSYIWTSSDKSLNSKTISNSITVNPSNTKVTYYAYARDSSNSGCLSNIDSTTVLSVSKQDLIISNLITANNDNKNDYLFAGEPLQNNTYKAILPGAKLEVYNNWGSEVFRSDNYNNSFNGHNLSDGIYFYHLKTGCGGESYKGWVQIVGSEK